MSFFTGEDLYNVHQMFNEQCTNDGEKYDSNENNVNDRDTFIVSLKFFFQI